MKDSDFWKQVMLIVVEMVDFLFNNQTEQD